MCFARWLHTRKPPTRRVVSNVLNSVSIVCLSDTHSSCPKVPDGDVLLHAGDLTQHGTFEELQAQLDWLNTLPHRHKVVIAGNHDLLLDPCFVGRFPDRIYEGDGTSRSDLGWGGIIYLENSTARLELAGAGGGRRVLTVYGSPWTEQFGTWVFQYPPIRQMWPESMPASADVVLVHGPPRGRLDGDKGCPQLSREIRRVRPRLVVFGHVHHGRGREDVAYDAVESMYDGVMAGDRGSLPSP